jgi:hypothetical protein
MHVIRDVLDKQLVDRDGIEIGRVDGIVVEVRPGERPRVVELEVGFVPLARRLSRRFERIAESLHERFGVRRHARYGIPWSSVLEVKKECLRADVCAEESVAYDWELWLRQHVVLKLPGASSEEE